MADEFGGEIPLGPVRPDRRRLDRSRHRRDPRRAPLHAVIMQNHGVFTIGEDPRAAVKAAVMCEDVARSTHLARQLGKLVPIPQDDVDALYDRYQNVYGQPGGTAP
jgi:L-ribulose-5-phosphate 4-epimerase